MANLIKINLPGGIVSPGDLNTILKEASKLGVDQVRFGNRQQLLFQVNDEQLDDLRDSFMVNEIEYEIDADEFPNIMSSYVTEEVFYTPNWLREGVYKDIIGSFSHRPRLKINIADYYQNLIPFFTGNLNFISSPVSNFWYLYIRFPKTNQMYCWPVLVYTEDIAAFSMELEALIPADPSKYLNQERPDGTKLYELIKQKKGFLTQAFEHPLVHTDFQLPYYEGFNRYRDSKLWLGIYRRKEDFQVSFLQEICRLCLQTRIGQLYTTAWKSLVVKNIDLDDRKYWGNLLNQYRINVRHAANELNWQTEDFCEEALAIKLNLVKYFEEADLRTYRLCFAIKTKPQTGLFGSVIIRKRSTKAADGGVIFELSHTRDFNPNTKEYIIVSSDLSAFQLGEKLVEVCEHFYSRRHAEIEMNSGPEHVPAVAAAEMKYVFQCSHCMTVYDEEYGDCVMNIPAGVPFQFLATYFCPTCSAPKEDFMEVKKLLVL